MSQFLLSLAESGYIPDAVIKIAVRFITNNRLKESSINDNKNEIIPEYLEEFTTNFWEEF